LALGLLDLHPALNGIYQAFVIYSMVALSDLCRHGLAIDRAGDLEGARRAVSMLVGPVRQDGILVTETWIGDEGDPEGGQDGDLRRMCVLVVVTCLLAVVLAMLALAAVSYGP